MQLISTTQRFEKTTNFKNCGETTSSQYPQNKTFEKQGSDIPSILAPKSARRRHSIDTRNRMSKDATFHRYLQDHSAGRRLLVDTCIFENQTGYKCHKPAIDATKQKTWLSRQQTKNLALKKKTAINATKNRLSMPQNWLSMPQKSGFHATNKPWPSRHKPKIWLPCQNNHLTKDFRKMKNFWE